MENFKKWLLEKEHKMTEMGTSTSSVAIFSQPFIGGSFRREWPRMIGGEIIEDKPKKKKKKLKENNQMTSYYSSGGGTASGQPMSSPGPKDSTLSPDTKLSVGKITDDELESSVGLRRSKFSMEDYTGVNRNAFSSLLQVYKKTKDPNLELIIRLAINGQDDELLYWYKGASIN